MDTQTAILAGIAGFGAITAWKWFLSRRTPDQVAEMSNMLNEGGKLVDVRTEGEFSMGHLRGAVCLPLSSLQGKLGTLGKKTSPVIVYCASGSRSRAAVDILKSAGFTHVRDLGPIRNGKLIGREVSR